MKIGIFFYKYILQENTLFYLQGEHFYSVVCICMVDIRSKQSNKKDSKT